MIPKSTAKLSLGDYCLIKRGDGKLVPFIFIEAQKNARSYFYGGLGKVLLNEGEDIPEEVKIEDYALMHIKCFKENNTPIEGNLRSSLNPQEIEAIHSNLNSMEIGSKHRTWGYRMPLNYAEKLIP